MSECKHGYYCKDGTPCALCHEDELAALRAKLQEAEEATTRIRIAHETEVLNSNCLRKRAEAAEAEVERLTDCLETQYEINRNTARAACEARGDHFDAEDRIEELEAEVAILKDVRATEQYLASLPVGDKELDFAKRTATEAALRWVIAELRRAGFVVPEDYEQEIVAAGIKALLGEVEAK